MQSKNPHFESVVRKIFDSAPFIRSLGMQLTRLEEGSCQTELVIRPEHLQQNNIVHAGVQATMADHTAGTASGTLIGPDEIVLTVEFKINLLRPASGASLRAVARVIKPGKRLIITESDVFALSPKGEIHVARAMVTLAVVPAKGY